MWDINHKFKDFDRFFVGFDPIVKKFAEAAEQTAKLATNYPPYNIKKIDENKYVIEMAVAGFGQNEIDIEIDGDRIFGRHDLDLRRARHRPGEGEQRSQGPAWARERRRHRGWTSLYR